MAARSFTLQILFLLSGLVIWAVHFLVVYGFNALACARGFAGVTVLGIGIVPVVIVMATILAVAGILAAIVLAAAARGPMSTRNADDPNAPFLRYMTIAVASLSLVAIIWEALPVLIVPPCA